MYLPIAPQPDCASTWREAVRAVDGESGHAAYNVILDVADPATNNTRQDRRVAVVEDFLSGCEKSVEAVANTIFPAALYERYKMPGPLHRSVSATSVSCRRSAATSDGPAITSSG